jgi:hypothetical protein
MRGRRLNGPSSPDNRDLLPVDKGVGVAENPRSGVEARGSRVKNGLSWAKLAHPMTSTALPLHNLLTAGSYDQEIQRSLKEL